MLKENWRLVSRIERIGDFFLIIVSFFIAYYGRGSLLFWNDHFNWQIPFTGSLLAPLKDYFIILVMALIYYMAILSLLGAYNSMRLRSKFELLRISVLCSIVVFVFLSATLYLLKIDLSRSFIALFCLLVALSLSAQRYLVLEVLRFWRRRGRNYRNLIICGVGEQAQRIAREIEHRTELGLRIFAFCDLAGSVQGQELKQLLGVNREIRMFQGKDGMINALKNQAVDEVIFADVIEVMPEVEELVVICSEQGVRTTIVADLFSVGLVNSGLSYFGGIPLIHFQTPPGDRWELTLKRIIDISISAMLLFVLSPFLILMGLAVKCGSPGPVIFRQKRVGLNGRLFFLYKFRSMYFGAEKELTKLRDSNEMDGPVFKMKNDPRVTGIGRFLRRFSLDELPQLWNVLWGDMSLVGPRPPIPGEVSMYERKDRRRLSMRPGMTCIWQVSGRNNINSFQSWVKMDLEYIDNWSLWNDFILLLRTIPAVLFGTGAR